MAQGSAHVPRVTFEMIGPLLHGAAYCIAQEHKNMRLIGASPPDAAVNRTSAGDAASPMYRPELERDGNPPNLYEVLTLGKMTIFGHSATTEILELSG